MYPREDIFVKGVRMPFFQSSCTFLFVAEFLSVFLELNGVCYCPNNF